VWATSWGVSTRLLGAMVMTHSDDKGLVLPPRVAPIQVVIVPIVKGKGHEKIDDEVMNRAKEIFNALKAQKIRTKIDDRPNIRPGAKYFEWERKGLPIRLEIGPKDVQNDCAVMAVRHTGEKSSISTKEAIAETVRDALRNIHDELLVTAKARLQAKTYRVHSYQELREKIERANAGETSQAGFYQVAWKCDAANEARIKEECKATIRCYPLDLNEKPPVSEKCFYSGDQATHIAIFARAF
jgi:prolyl-tRNA synthetase